MTRFFAGVSVVAACFACALPAQAQDTLLDHQLSEDTDLVAALDAGDPQATAFIAGAMGALMVRGAQGDPLLWWVQQCLIMTFAGPAAIEPGIRAWVADRPENAQMASFAANAVLHALAGFCGDHMDPSDVTLPE